ncbi:hypothetical protein LCGC14_2348840 [marine sediment metagenome]|uniref:Uncharacterized protein n=1 Tax=marine sediment metagenome TaxID=412755 RepID=A0A0F9EMF7_9ZZZZ
MSLTDSYMERINLSNDRRFQQSFISPAFAIVSAGPNEMVIDVSETVLERLVEDGHVDENHIGHFKIPTKFQVCPTCRGSGTMVNPNIDAGGLTQDDFDGDPDFYDDYMDGSYDIQCSECRGERVIPEIRWNVVAKHLSDAIHRWEQDDADYLAECMSEFRHGC